MESTIKNKQHHFWKEHIEQWEASGLSQPAYCKLQSLKLSTFLYYRSLFNRQQAVLEPVNFVQAPKQLNSSAPVATLQLMLPNGIRIGISSELNESVLRMALTVAGQIAC